MSLAGRTKDTAETKTKGWRSMLRVQICDFALVRSVGVEHRTYTAKVVTMWYRAPEILLGGRYSLSVDVWSAGCVLGEMLLGRPLFPGISCIDQLFLIFSTLGTPTPRSWSECFTMEMTNVVAKPGERAGNPLFPENRFSYIFPKWPQAPREAA